METHPAKQGSCRLLSASDVPGEEDCYRRSAPAWSTTQGLRSSCSSPAVQPRGDSYPLRRCPLPAPRYSASSHRTAVSFSGRRGACAIWGQGSLQVPMTFITAKTRWTALPRAPRSGYTLPSTPSSQGRGSWCIGPSREAAGDGGALLLHRAVSIALGARDAPARNAAPAQGKGIWV